MNSFCLVGQIDSQPVLEQANGGIRKATLILKVQRPFKSSDGSYAFDYIPIQIWRGLAETICAADTAEKWITVKGRIASSLQPCRAGQDEAITFVAESIGFIH